MTARAVFNGMVIAESYDTVVLEGNHYFRSDPWVRRIRNRRSGAAWRSRRCDG
jgi:uncharacterized protein (DUF427 family)